MFVLDWRVRARLDLSRGATTHLRDGGNLGAHAVK